MKQKKARVEDALHATRAAVEEGILPGGGVALLRCHEAVEGGAQFGQGRREDRRRHRAAFARRPDQADRRQLRHRRLGGGRRSEPEAGATSATTPTRGKYVDMFKAGIIDPLKVVRAALTNAASIAGLMLTTEALVTDLDKDDKEKNRVEGSIR